MIKSIIKYVNKPFPTIVSNREKIIMPIGFASFIFLFLYIFQPFSISDTPEKALFYSFGFAGITFSISLINNYLLPVVFPKIFDGDNYKVKHNLYFTIWFLFTIALGNWMFSYYFIPRENTEAGFIQYLFYTVAVGIFPMTIGAYITEVKMNRRNNNLAKQANEDINRQVGEIQSKDLVFVSDKKHESITINSKNLICIKSDGNYCEFYYQQNEIIKRHILRFTMKMTSLVLENSPQIIRCHRSYFININKVNSVSGTARNITLHIDNLEFTIPVSRANELTVTNAIRHIHTK